ncbi:nucleotidyltransferase domain-containing protein [Couchioplanes caeruleus]|uniref:nucleotidyltransferase domain-containing protein n=1 Tax=Couchioplanes caeruleus TaxID=56438 RepID=UPI0020BEF9B5|nr:nucleotidyltransferase domain-containing protein [Couchioplanes caeruleus]UQU61581.1 nucleotidyltransferase domain-containing protein [Couchioplanes caeruleus]
MTTDVPAWAAEAAVLPYPTVFVTVSGAHLYGFASVDSDLDLRASHLLPAQEVVGLRTGPETITTDTWRDGVELDVVSHDLLKFTRLLTTRNGYVLEQLLSPLVVTTSPVHAALIELAPGLITRHHAHHYLGFAATQERLFGTTGELKPALYTLRVLHTGIHLMRTGSVVADLGTLSPLPYVPELIAMKRSAEHAAFPAELRKTFRQDAAALRAELERARDASALREQADPDAVEALHELVVRTRLA